MLDFKGIFGAIMREGICYDLRSRVDAKACFSTIVRCTCLLPVIPLGRNAARCFLRNFGAEKVFIDFLILLQREFIMRLEGLWSLIIKNHHETGPVLSIPFQNHFWGRGMKQLLKRESTVCV